MKDQHLQRAYLLLEQNRPQLALEEFGRLSVESPNDDEILRGMAICQHRLGNLREAEISARQAIQANPDEPGNHIILGGIFLDRHLFEEAHRATDHAISLDPFQPFAYQTSASIYLAQRKWKEAEAMARRGLEIDPNDDDIQSILGLALQSQGKHAESSRQLGETLARNPENATTIALLGWTQLQAGNYQQALASFQESLRLEPGNETAREGLSTALKARYVIYRLLLNWYFWMNRFSGKVQFLIIIGLFVGIRLLRSLAQQNAALQVFVFPIFVLYLVFAAFSWWGESIFNLLLRSSKYGRHALTDSEKRHSNWMGLLFGLMITGLLVWIAGLSLENTVLSVFGLTSLILIGVTSLPLSVIPNCSEGWPRNVALGLTGIFGLIAILHVLSGLGMFLINDELVSSLLILLKFGTFIIGAIGGFIMEFLLGFLQQARPARDNYPAY